MTNDKKSLREEIVDNLEPYHREIHLYTGYGESELADKILSLIRQRISECVLSDEEIKEHKCENGFYNPVEISQAQIDKILKEVLGWK